MRKIPKSIINYRYLLWMKRSSTKGKLGKAIQLRTIHPTTESFQLHVMRAHYQTILWMHALDADPPLLDPCQVF